MTRKQQAPSARQSAFRLSTATHQGGRASNEDACACVITPVASVVVLADGAGGHAGGEVASDVAVREAVEFFRQRGTEPPGRANLVGAMRAAQKRVRAESAATPRFRDMRTTILVVQATRDAAWIGHVGDSRAYLVRDGRAEQLTRDDTLVQSLVDNGKIDREKAKKHSQSHVLLQSLGDPRELDYHTTDAIAMRPGDVLIACSDGLSEVLGDEEIARLARAGSSREIALQLVSAAVARGTTDNVTAAVISWHASRAPTVALHGRVVRSRRSWALPVGLAVAAVALAAAMMLSTRLRRPAAAPSVATHQATPDPRAAATPTPPETHPTESAPPSAAALQDGGAATPETPPGAAGAPSAEASPPPERAARHRRRRRSQGR